MPFALFVALFNRRQITGLLALLALTVLLGIRPGAATERLAVTPTDDFGPFYPLDWQGEIDPDLTAFGSAKTEGERLGLSGVVRDRAGRPVVDAVVEIWQADGRGRYRHPGVPEHLRDQGFQGYGRSTTDAKGRYAFTTVMPGRYGGRPPHIHFRLAQPGRAEFVTQMYFRGDNREGGSAGTLGTLPAGREGLTVDITAAPKGVGGWIARFDLVVP